LNSFPSDNGDDFAALMRLEQERPAGVGQQQRVEGSVERVAQATPV
jgi:hypothetical protein